MSGACRYGEVEKYGIRVKTRLEAHEPAIFEGVTEGDRSITTVSRTLDVEELSEAERERLLESGRNGDSPVPMS